MLSGYTRVMCMAVMCITLVVSHPGIKEIGDVQVEKLQVQPHVIWALS
jgi:hypothetical protein